MSQIQAIAMREMELWRDKVCSTIRSSDRPADYTHRSSSGYVIAFKVP